MYLIDEKTCRVIRVADGKIVAPAQSIDDADYMEYLNWVSYGNNPIIISSEQPTNPSKKITKLAFTNRFTVQEKVILELASMDNPQAPMAERELAASLRVYLEDIDRASFVDLEDPRLNDALIGLSYYGIIDPSRVSEIITSSINDNERYNGDL